MTFAEFKDELYRIRHNRIILRGKIKQLEVLYENHIPSAFSGAIDYSKDRVQKTPDPDAAVINNIQKYLDQRESLLKEISKIEEDNARVERIIFEVSTEDVGGALLRAYFIDGMDMRQLSTLWNYEVSYCYRLWRQKIKDLYERHKEELVHE